MIDLSAARAALPRGVLLRPLTPHADIRGDLTEIHRNEWPEGPPILQWDCIRTKANTLRGLHAHYERHEIYIVMRGRALMTFRDIGRDSPTAGRVAALEVDESFPLAIHVPHGMLHGAYFPVESTFLVGFSAYYVTSDEHGCRWDDPDTGIVWPCAAPAISERDAALPSFKAFLARRS